MNRKRKEKLALCRSLLGASQALRPPSTDAPGSRDPASPEKPRLCPICKTGRLIGLQALTASAGVDAATLQTVLDVLRA